MLESVANAHIFLIRPLYFLFFSLQFCNIMFALTLFCVIASAIADTIHDDPLTGAIVAVQMRCQGLMCPEWAMDVSRYDTIEHLGEEFEYQLYEDLPLGTTDTRSFQTYTAYHEKSRSMYSCAADYPNIGFDTHWVQTVNAAVNGTTPVVTNVVIAHPAGTTATTASTITVQRSMYRDDGSLFVIFNDGTFTSLDLDSQKHTVIGNLMTGIEGLGQYPMMSDAHVFDGNLLKSFFQDETGWPFLVVTDTSVTPFTQTTPVKINLYKGMTVVKPIAAHMMSTNPDMPLTLAIVLSGQFDSVMFVNEATGDFVYEESGIPSLWDFTTGILSSLECYEVTKDCDYWRTSSYDPVNRALFIQSHIYDPANEDLPPSLAMMKLGWTQSHINGKWYPYYNEAQWIMNFGYSGYEYVQIIGA